MVVSRRNSLTSSFNFLTRATSFERNFWVGYAARTVRESTHGTRVARMVYEHVGKTARQALKAARDTGFKTKGELLPYHLQLLQVDDPFR